MTDAQREKIIGIVMGVYDGLRWGLLITAIVLAFVVVTQWAEYSEATYQIVRDIRGELRSAVGAKEATEE